MTTPIFVLTLDVDETLLNGKSETPSSHCFDFNGSPKFNDVTPWVRLIRYVQSYCAKQGYQLIVNLISAKVNGNLDDTIDACQHYLSAFLQARDHQGRIIVIGHDEQYLVHRHLGNELYSELYYNKLLEKNKLKPYDGENYLDPHVQPSIHLCFNNHPQGKTEVSKALVLEKIRAFYGITPAQMLHIDNAIGICKDLKSGAGGLTVPFNYVNCNQLEVLQLSSKAERTRTTKIVMKIIKQRIRQQVSKLPIVSHSSIAPSSTVSSGGGASSHFESAVLTSYQREEMKAMIDNLLIQVQAQESLGACIYRFFVAPSIKISPDSAVTQIENSRQRLFQFKAYLENNDTTILVEPLLEKLKEIEKETALVPEVKAFFSDCCSLLTPSFSFELK